MPLKFVFTMLIFWSCTSKHSKKQPILLADREAPLGWVYLKLYSDSSFEFISSGLRDSDIYPGTFTLRNDTLFFKYSDSIPHLKGFKAIVTKTSVSYIDATYPESVEIKLNKLRIKEDATNKFFLQNHLAIAKHFAESYLPDSIPNNGIAEVPNAPDSVLIAFDALDSIDRKAKEKYLTLIFLKIYRAHEQCCHQSYELRNKVSGSIDSLADPLLYRYNLVTRQYNQARTEFVSSHMAYDWVDRNRYLLGYAKIRTEYNTIKRVNDSITKGLYWK